MSGIASTAQETALRIHMGCLQEVYADVADRDQKLLNHDQGRMDRLYPSSAKTGVDRKPFLNDRLFLLTRPREGSRELAADGLGDADIAIEGRDEHETRTGCASRGSTS